MNSKEKYNIINKLTKQTVATASSLKSARRVIDKRDNAYGAYVHTYVKVEV